MNERQYQEIWIEKPDGQSMCALINGDIGWLMYLRHNRDAGFTSRNPDFFGLESATIDYVLSNGQKDEYPACWALSVSIIKRALNFFEKEGRPPNFILWHNDSDDDSTIEFIPLA